MNLNFFYEPVQQENTDCIVPFTHEIMPEDAKVKTQKHRVVAKAYGYTVAIIDATVFEDSETGKNDKVLIISHTLEGNENKGIEREMIDILKHNIKNCTKKTKWKSYDLATSDILDEFSHKS